MNFDLHNHTILVTIAGSRAYGTHTPESDVDIKGVCVPPLKYATGFLHHFDQIDTPDHIKTFTKYLRSEEKEALDRGEKLEGTIYAHNKFIKLATDCNPNILDVLFCRDGDVIYFTGKGLLLRDARDLFLSAKAKHTFSGYAMAQLKRIKGHRQWLLHPPTHEPTRDEYGLTPQPTKLYYEVWDGIKKKLDTWEWDFDGVSDPDIIRIQEQIANTLTDIGINADDKWIYAARSLGANDELIDHIKKEKAYQDATGEWKRYQNWKKTRNPIRAILEEKYGFDAKHASHLVRLYEMGLEILTTGKVNVWREDAEKLLAIRNGAWTYDQLVDWAEQKNLELTQIYRSRQYVVPHKPDIKKLDELCQSLWW